MCQFHGFCIRSSYLHLSKWLWNWEKKQIRITWENLNTTYLNSPVLTWPLQTPFPYCLVPNVAHICYNCNSLVTYTNWIENAFIKRKYSTDIFLNKITHTLSTVQVLKPTLDQNKIHSPPPTTTYFPGDNYSTPSPLDTLDNLLVHLSRPHQIDSLKTTIILQNPSQISTNKINKNLWWEAKVVTPWNLQWLDGNINFGRGSM